MLNIKDFEKEFYGKPVPSELAKLLEFQNKFGEETYSECFSLSYYKDRFKELETWSDSAEFVNSIYPFARANGSGSFYALWDNKKGSELSDVPVVIFGDEGGIFIVARNLLGFLQILAFGPEPSVDPESGVTLYKGDDFEPQENAAAYVEWLKETFKIEKIQDPESIIREAQNECQQLFTDWSSKLLKKY